MTQINTPPPAPPITDFDKQVAADMADVDACAKEVNDAIAKEGADKADYDLKLDSVDQLIKQGKTALALAELFFLMGASDSNSTAAGHFQNDIGITGKRLKLNGALTKVSSDFSTMFNSGDKDPNNLKVFDQEINIMQDKLSDTSGPLYQAMDSGTLGQMKTEYDAIDAMFSSGGHSGTGVYFDATDPTKINSFEDLQTCLKSQSDAKGSTEAAQGFSNANATLVQTSQTTSAVLNNDMKTESSVLQAIEQFLGSLYQMNHEQIKTTLQKLGS